ncbi:toll-like receptor 4 [Mytilus galloprovincialis]|uniref:toll-like receptor 4 n=1 Tax=Mytilus galloprovincialis TaxID=29158 RepID=UPI003F7C95F2
MYKRSIVMFFSCVCWIYITAAKNHCRKPKNTTGSIVADCSHENLTQVPKNLSDNITVLILDHNEIKMIKNGAFSNLNVLIDLTINNNKLKSLESHAFIGLTSLKTLKMSCNNLDFTAYTPILFRFITNISLLDISRNMNFSNNAKLATYYPDKALGVLVNLETLAIDLGPIPVFGEGFKKMDKLKVLEFDKCKVEVLNYSTFINFNWSIEYLHMNRCQQFVKAEKDTLQHFPNLKVLDLSDTFVHPIQAFQLLKPLVNSSMERINFHHVNDESITNHSAYSYEVNITKEMVTYLQTICVEVFDISKNNIVDFEDGSLLTFNRPECFLNISLSENRFSLFHAHRLENIKQFFNRTQNLTKFEYSFIPLSFINYPPIAVSNLTNITEERVITLPSSIKEVHMSHVLHSGQPVLWKIPPNAIINRFDVSFCKTVDQATISNGSVIEYLDVTGVDSRVVFDKIQLYPLFKLKTLVMKSTNLYITNKHEKNIFTFISGTERLDISYNFLWNMTSDIFEKMTRLTNLNMSNNLLRAVPLAITRIPNLMELDLTSNLLTNINRTFQEFFDVLHTRNGPFTLHLGNNAFVCDCTNYDFIRWLHRSNITFDANKTYQCLLHNSSEINTSTAAEHFNELFAGCDSGVWLKAGIGLIVAFIAIFFPFTLIYSFRWRISFYLYKRFRHTLEKGIDVKFKYDVFVYYPDSELAWIKYILMPELERKWGLKMCIEHRDFPVGRPIADAFADCIEQSRHIIFIVTSSFKNDIWGQYAVERAKYHHFSQNLQKIIVITKGIDMEELPHDLAVLWKDLAFIAWPIDNDKDLENVWNKLRLWLFLNHSN